MKAFAFLLQAAAGGDPAQVADPMAGVARTGKEPTIGVDFRTSQPGWAMALGLSLCPTDL